MMQEKISIIVPIYNMEKYLENCIQSLLKQTYTNIEILLINDGSTDGSAKICKKYSEIDERIIYIEQKNAGASVARNTGIYRASGMWISFVDGDDWISPDMASTLLKKAKDSDVIVGDFYAVENRKLTKSSFYADNIEPQKRNNTLYLIGNALGSARFGAGKYSNIGVPWAKLYRRSFLLEKRLEFPKGIRRMQDMVFNINVFLRTSNVAFCSSPVYYYRILKNSACRRYDPDFDEVSQQILVAIKGPLNDSADSNMQEMYNYKRISLLLENISLYYGHLQCSLSYREKIKGIKSLCKKSGNEKLLKKCPYALFTWQQQCLLWLLSHKLYRCAYSVYSLRNRIRNIAAK